MRSLSFVRSLSALSLAKAAALALVLSASVLGSLADTAFAQPTLEQQLLAVVPAPGKPELSAILTIKTSSTVSVTNRRMILVCTVKNTGNRPSGPFVTVVTGQFNTGATFRQVFPMNVGAAGTQSVSLPAGFISGGPALAWAKCSVDDTRLVQESNESNNITDLILQPVGS